MTMRPLPLTVVVSLPATCCIPAAPPRDAASGKRTGNPPERPSPESIISQYRNSTDKPPAFGHYWKQSTDALLMGNGDLGLSVGGEAESLRFWINKNDFWRLQNQHLGARPKLFGWIDLKAPGLQGASYRIEQPIYNPIASGSPTV